jgi:YesN/AraC family two-component response regulator
MDLIKVNSISKTINGSINNKLDDLIENLTLALFDPNYISFKRYLEAAYISVLKPSLQAESVQQFRAQLELLHQLLLSIYIPQDADLSDAFGDSHLTIEEEYKAVGDAFSRLHDIIIGSDRAPLGNHILKVIVFCIIHYGDNYILSDYARLINVTPSYLSHFFKTKTGMAFGDFLTNIKIIRAKRMLGSTQMKIIEISDAIGFLDYHYFSRVFRKITGITPTLYRARMTSTPVDTKII